MHKKSSSLKHVVLGLLAICALAGAAAAAGAGGDRPVPPGHNFLFDKDAFSVIGSQSEGAASKAFSRLSLRLYGGYSNVAAGDVNDGSAFYFDLIEYYAAEGGATFTGGYSPLHGGYNFGADLIYQITPSIGIGLGAGYIRNSADSLATYTDEDFSVDITVNPKLAVVPIRLGAFFTFPLGGKLNLTADAGATYYAGLQFDATQRLDYIDDSWMEQSLSGRERSGADIGFQGGLGFEYMFSPKMGFFVEAAGRYAKLKNFEQVSGITNYSDGSSDTVDGKLYIVTDTIGTTEINMFTIEETPPTEGDVREPKFDLSGFSLQAGIRIRF